MGKRNEPTDVFKLYDMAPGDACWTWAGSWGGGDRGDKERRPYFMADGKRMTAYKWVWELVNGPIPMGMMILHSCDHGGYPTGCGQPKHMRLGTAQDNMDDMRIRQRHGLPRTVVTAIRTLIERGDTQEQIAHLYGVSRETISAIATGRVYKPIARPQAAMRIGDTNSTNEETNQC